MVTTTKRNKCQAVTKAGKPCQAWALGGFDYCFIHEPSKAAERAAARSKGGRARHGRNIGGVGDIGSISVNTPADVLDVIKKAIEDVSRLENSISRARCLGYLASVAIKVFEFAEIEGRLQVLESEVVQNYKSRSYHGYN